MVQHKLSKGKDNLCCIFYVYEQKKSILIFLLGFGRNVKLTRQRNPIYFRGNRVLKIRLKELQNKKVFLQLKKLTSFLAFL